jgi:hypothetical protein
MFAMKSGFSASSLARLLGWTERNQRRTLALSIMSLVVSLFGFLFTSTIQVIPADLKTAVNIVGLVSAIFIILSVATKGIVPVVISILGIVLIHNSIILPLYATPEVGDPILRGQRVVGIFESTVTVQVAGAMHFLLGASMVVFARLIAYRPSTLFARNRPVSEEEEWSKYPRWHDNAVLADGRTERAVPIRNMMTDQDRHLLWRYEFILASIYGSLHLVRPDGMVPKDSTELLRDKGTGRLYGKAKYGGFFV